MAKRELIDKKKLIGKMKQSNAFDISERMKFSNLIEQQSFITEQEIVKPYLKKLRAKINEEIDFEEQWLNDVFREDKGITLRDIEIAMNGIRHVVKGELEE